MILEPDLPKRLFNLKDRLKYGPDRRWVVCNPQNPDALIFHVWPEFAEKLIDLDQRCPDIWKKSERKMQLWVKPTYLLDQLRCLFWANVYQARSLGIKVRRDEILAGFMGEDAWETIIKNDANLAYFVRPIPRINAAFEALMWRGYQKLTEIIEGPKDYAVLSPHGKRNYLVMIFSIMRECEHRLHRDVQRRETREVLRKQVEEEVLACGVSLNRVEPTAEDPFPGFEMKDLPDEMEFGESELDEEGADDDRPDTGD